MTAPVTGSRTLSEAARSVWGKTDRTGRSAVGWLPLWRHLADSAGVAGQLWDQWLSPAARRVIAEQLPGGDADGRVLARWLTGVHDIGKVTPAFAIQAPALADRMRAHGLDFNTGLVKADRRHGPHATAGHIILAEYLRDRGWTNPDQVAVVVGGHHGIPPTDAALLAVETRPHLLGDGPWSDVRAELLAWAGDRTGADQRLDDWSTLALSQPGQAALTALVVMADWIASNEKYFPYTGITDSDRLIAGWDELDLPAPWTPVAATATADLFTARFDLPPGAAPRPVQLAAMELATTMPVPGLMVVEAPMGEGKTEAAFSAAEILAERAGASGCYVALPTRATSDALFERMLSWLRRLPDADPDHGIRDVRLAHGKAAFNPEYDRLRYTSLPTAIAQDAGGADLGVHKWLAGPKRTMLSSFVVGTIDQLLFAALRGRFLVLRHLGLAGKIVIIDEAHAYDVFMSTYLDRALEWLGAYGVPVIVLSATLPAQRRAAMMRAYDIGRLGAVTRAERRGGPDPYASVRADHRYPLVTTNTPQRGATSLAVAESGRSVTVAVHRLDDDLPSLINLLRERLGSGGCALVVRNTVARVQETAATLRAAFIPDIPVSVAHSRFMAADRAAKDAWLRTAFGPGDGGRPDRHIVVASQVAEQSLDIDFDLLVTDLAPVDLVLQRLGRVHRHPRVARPAPVAEPACWITGVDWAETPPRPVAGSRRVYHPHTLLRGAAVLAAHLDGVALRLPQDISPLTQAAYGDEPVGAAQWQPEMDRTRAAYLDEQADKERRAGNYRIPAVARPGTALIGWLSGAADTLTDRAAQGHVRDSGAESLEVLLLVRGSDGLILPPWTEGGGTVVTTEAVPPWPLPHRIARCSLPLPQMMTAPDVIDEVIADLERRIDLRAWQSEPWLAGELVLDIDAEGRADVGSFALQYDPADGLRVTRH